MSALSPPGRPRLASLSSGSLDRAPGPARDMDWVPRRHPDRPGRGSRRSPSAPWTAIGSHRQG